MPSSHLRQWPTLPTLAFQTRSSLPKKQTSQKSWSWYIYYVESFVESAFEDFFTMFFMSTMCRIFFTMCFVFTMYKSFLESALGNFFELVFFELVFLDLYILPEVFGLILAAVR